MVTQIVSGHAKTKLAAITHLRLLATCQSEGVQELEFSPTATSRSRFDSLYRQLILVKAVSGTLRRIDVDIGGRTNTPLFC